MTSQGIRERTTDTIVPFVTADGMYCNVTNVRGDEKPRNGPVLLVHGAGVRGNIFRAPVETTIVDALLASGYDVWLENWRASIDLVPNLWNLDRAALYDHPAAVKTVLGSTGSTKLKAIIHCQGSTSFMMSAVAGLLPEVEVIVSNAVSLHPTVPTFSSLKMKYALPALELLTEYLNPQWGRVRPSLAAKIVNLFVQLTHHECSNAVCKQVSFTYGSGFPALWSHANLNEKTHAWLTDEFAKVPTTFFAQMAKCVEAGHLVSIEGFAELPADYTAQPPRTDARISLVAGSKNKCFLPESQSKTFEFLRTRGSGRYALHVIPDYGHLDIFMGKDAARDVFPTILEALHD